MIQRQVYRLKAGNTNRLIITPEQLPPPGDDEIQIQVQVIGLNFADVFAILGLYSATPDGPFIPGLEYAGQVIAKGNQVADYKVGDRIMGVTRFGAYTTHLNINPSYVLPLPQNWSYAEGASYLVQVLTAYYGLKNLGNLKADHTVLIHSAAGGVGIWANRICKALGAYTIGTVGSNKKIELLKAEGYDSYIIRDQRTFKQELDTKLEGRPLDLIMECIGGKVMTIGFETSLSWPLTSSIYLTM
jgi:alcohol dehydrogenase